MAARCCLLVHLILVVTTTGGTVKAPNTDCKSMTSCDLFSEIQKHSMLIGGFSYNVRKADSTLMQLRADKISLTNRVQALEEELNESGNDTVLLTNQDVINKLSGQGKELDRSINTLSSKLNQLQEEVNVIFLDNLRNNDKDLESLQLKVVQLNEQVERLDAIVRNHTENFGLITSPENPKVTDFDQRQISAQKMKLNRLESQVEELTKSCLSGGEGNSIESLGIELETVKSSYDTLQDQVTELQDKCVSQNEEIERTLEELTRKVEELEARQQKKET